MTHKLHYDAEFDCVVLTVEGKVTLDRIRALAPAVARMCEENNCWRFLNDMRKAIIDLSLLDAYESPNIMDESGISQKLKRVLVVSPDFVEADFLATVTRNRGHDFMVFHDIDVARQWLLNGC